MQIGTAQWTHRIEQTSVSVEGFEVDDVVEGIAGADPEADASAADRRDQRLEGVREGAPATVGRRILRGDVRPGPERADRRGDGVRRANAHEFDVLPSTFARLQREPSPAGGTVPADPAGVAVLARGRVHWRKGGSAFDYFSRRVQPVEDTGADLVYWERPGGGRVFNAGAIGAGWVLAGGAVAGLARMW